MSEPAKGYRHIATVRAELLRAPGLWTSEDRQAAANINARLAIYHPPAGLDPADSTAIIFDLLRYSHYLKNKLCDDVTPFLTYRPPPSKTKREMLAELERIHSNV